jgi:hypothetical protein
MLFSKALFVLELCYVLTNYFCFWFSVSDMECLLHTVIVVVLYDVAEVHVGSCT